jgi:hypothetical protein
LKRCNVIRSASASSTSTRSTPEAWGCKEEAYCVHILTHKRDNPNYDPVAGRWDRCIEDKKDAATADALAADIEALGKIDDRELHSNNTFYTRQVYVGVE